MPYQKTNFIGIFHVLLNNLYSRDAHSLAFGTETASARGIERLAQEMDSQQKKRGQFSRRRAYDDEADVYVFFIFTIHSINRTFINERNMRFNKKISRAYDKYTFFVDFSSYLFPYIDIQKTSSRVSREELLYNKLVCTFII